jgi:hypothetical protein
VQREKERENEMGSEREARADGDAASQTRPDFRPQVTMKMMKINPHIAIDWFGLFFIVVCRE